MNPFRKNDQNKKNTPPEPLCLFCLPEDVLSISSFKTTYVNVLPKGEPPARCKRRKPVKKEEIASRTEFWQKKRAEAKIIRRRMKEPIKNLKSYLLTSVKNDSTNVLPSLFEVLETVKDAWPPTPKRSAFSIKQYQKADQDEKTKTFVTPKMKKEIQIQLPSPLPNRRFSMPEELMRKYSMSLEKSCEESEENKTMVDMSFSSSSSTEQEETVRTKKIAMSEVQTAILQPNWECKTAKVENKDNIYKEVEKKTETVLPKRVTQNDFYCQGKRFLKVKSVEKSIQVDECLCRTEKIESTTVSFKEETEESVTTESISSSPFLLPKCGSSSDNISSESDCMRCTCRELTSSKETSIDFFHSGKSTLSQTVTDKSSSTQDTTISVRSISTRGSSESDGSYSTPEGERTSAKETTTTSDYSPRTLKNTMNRKSRRKEKYHQENYYQKLCPKTKHSRNFVCKNQCDLYFKNKIDTKKSSGATTEISIETGEHWKKTENPKIEINKTINQPNQITKDKHKNGKLSAEELYLMQQLRHQKLFEKEFKIPIELKGHEPVNIVANNKESIVTTAVKTSISEKKQFSDQNIMIPRFSALPRTLSMVVNTSSADNNSDSDNQSLVDSLEDQPITHTHNLYFDTKKESKPVRGDANTLLESKQILRPPKGKAFFVSIKDPYGESEMLEGIHRIPQPPEKIKNKIFERHLSICTKYRQFYKVHGDAKSKDKKKKSTKNENSEKTNEQKNKKEQKTTIKKENDDEKSAKKTQKEEEKKEKSQTSFKRKTKIKDQKGKFNSKIPVLVSNRSFSSIEEDNLNRKTMKKERVETTQILKITPSNEEVGLHKPQVVVYPSEIPFDAEGLHEKNLFRPLIMPHFSDSKIPPPLSQPYNKQIFFTPIRKSPVPKFRQIFEVIPEEKSSSISSTEEKIAPDSRFKDISTSPIEAENLNSNQAQISTSSTDDVPNLLVTKIKDTSFENLPYLKNNDNQKIILFSSTTQNSNSNSTKGRDALFAMNQEDFKRLAKGWMNFYKIIENWEISDDEKLTSQQIIKENIKTNTTHNLKDNNLKNYTTDINKNNDKNMSNKQRTKIRKTLKSKKFDDNQSKSKWKSLKSPEVDENIRFHSSNTVLSTRKKMSGDFSRMSLPELNLPIRKEKKECKYKSTIDALPKVSKFLEDDDGSTDSESTDYMEPPSPRVPPLSIGEFLFDATLSSSDNELDEKKPQVTHQSRPFFEKKKGAINRTKAKENHFQTSRSEIKKNSSWSVTVAGTIECSKSSSDLEMRLSFPVIEKTPTLCQSDSGFAEDSNYSKLSESLQDLNLYTSKKDLSLRSGNIKQKWTVTVNNPNQGAETQDHESKCLKNTNPILPNLGPSQSRSTKTSLKVNEINKSLKIIERKLHAIWPKIQKIIQQEFLLESGRLVTEFQEELAEATLSVRGKAVVLKKKKKPLSTTERDVTKRYSSMTKRKI